MTSYQGQTPARVMIVDDHGMVRDAVRRAIDSPDIRVVAEADSAEDALAQLDAAVPDLILLDIDLPTASGIEIVSELRQRLPVAKIVMLTVSADDDDVQTAISMGATGYLTKDVSSDALLRAVQGALAGDLAMSRGMAQRLIERMGPQLKPSSRASVQDLLNPRELEILRLLSDGKTAHEIGDQIGLSSRTIEGYVGRILRKLGARNRVEAVQRYRQLQP